MYKSRVNGYDQWRGLQRDREYILTSSDLRHCGINCTFHVYCKNIIVKKSVKIFDFWPFISSKSWKILSSNLPRPCLSISKVVTITCHLSGGLHGEECKLQDGWDFVYHFHHHHCLLRFPREHSRTFKSSYWYLLSDISY